MTTEAGATPENPIDNATEWVAKQIAAYLASGGRESSHQGSAPLLLLTVKGAKSGLWRRTALIFGEHEGNYLVVASIGGAPKNPSWYVNLQHNPEVNLQVFDKKIRATARTADASEKPKLWEQMVSIWPDYANYQKKTDRDIPVVVLEPVTN